MKAHSFRSRVEGLGWLVGNDLPPASNGWRQRDASNFFYGCLFQATSSVAPCFPVVMLQMMVFQ